MRVHEGGPRAPVAERVDEAGWDRIHGALDAGDPNGEVRDINEVCLT